MAVGLGSTFEEVIKAINDSSGGGESGSGGIYVHVISFEFTESLNEYICRGVITITNSSNNNFIVDVNNSSNSYTNLTNFLSNIINSFYPLATTNTTGFDSPYVGISYNSDANECVVYLNNTSAQSDPLPITIDDTTFVETVIQTSTGGGGGGGGDVTAAGDNTFTGDNTFNGAVNIGLTELKSNAASSVLVVLPSESGNLALKSDITEAINTAITTALNTAV